MTRTSGLIFVSQKRLSGTPILLIHEAAECEAAEWEAAEWEAAHWEATHWEVTI